MLSYNEACFIAMSLETFFYGKIPVLCALNCTVVPLLKKFQLFLGGLGLYAGIFVLYLQRPPDKSRPIIVFYVLCLLYVLSTATVVIDLLSLILAVSKQFLICKNFIFFY